MVFITLLPLLILLVFVSLFLLKRITHGTVLKLVFGVYCLVLIGALLVYYFIPEENLLVVEEGRGQYSEEDEAFSMAFHDAAIDGTLGELDGVYLQKQWSFDVTTDQLKFVQGYSHVWTVVDKKEEADGEVEAFLYTTAHEFQGIDFTEKLVPVELQLENHLLTIEEPDVDQTRIRVAGFKREFVIWPFLEYGKNPWGQFNHVYMSGNQVLYLQIPSNVELSSDQHVTFTDEVYD
ncbi:MAG: hypothetical protein LRY73_02545 [Bacillus sp. (in: Bacteria)]|nr:hypothetical protein [Bacillus sp. (in: firmicutes)]